MPLYTQFRLRDVMIFVFRKSTSKLLMDLYKVLVRWNLTVFLVLLNQRNPSLNSQGKLKTFSLIRWWVLYADVCFFLYISGHVTVPNEFLPFRPFLVLLSKFYLLFTLRTGPPLIPVLITVMGLSCINIMMMMMIMMMLIMMMMMTMMMMMMVMTIILLPKHLMFKQFAVINLH